jgi:hypothetical protein
MTLSLSAESRLAWRNVLIPIGSAILLYAVLRETGSLFGWPYRDSSALGMAITLMFGLRAYLDRSLLANPVRSIALSVSFGLFAGMLLLRNF